MTIEKALTIGSILAIGLTIYACIAIVPERKRAYLTPFLQKLHDLFNLRSLLVEKILKTLYVFNTIVCETAGVLLLFARTSGWNGFSTWWIGLLAMILGPVLCRLLHETIMVFILLLKNTNDINRKISIGE